MQRQMRVLSIVVLCCALALSDGCLKPTEGQRDSASKHTAGQPVCEFVLESAREIPVLHEVDVVVVGGTSAAVTAAVAAAEGGAKVFLAAPRPYLGEDICGTYRLWLEPGEEPASAMAKALFAEPQAAAVLGRSLPFTYKADVESASPHKDASPPSLLNDGKWHSAPSQSVQYNNAVTIVADLGAEQSVDAVSVMAYQRNADFEVETVTVSASSDGQQWQEVAVVKNSKLGQGSFEDAAIPLPTAVGRKTRYLRFAVGKTPEAKRVLLGEILIEKKDEAVATPRHRMPPTPMQVKRVLDDALLDAGVPFLYGCYATELLEDERGRPAGIVVTNRSGRQAVKAQVIIDATPEATIARLAGARFDRYPPGTHIFRRIVVGGEIREGEPVIRARKLPSPVCAGNGRVYEAIEYTLGIPMKDGSCASFARAEQIARDATWHPEQVDASETLFHIPLDRMTGKTTQCCEWSGAGKVHLDVFRPAGVERLYVLGGCADVSRQGAERLLRPLEFMEVGSRIGAAAATDARRIREPQTVTVAGGLVEPVATGDLREDGEWMRLSGRTATVKAGERAVPVLGEYDVVVVGGGTGGAPAGIAAARQGAKTLVVEYLHGLGGVGTLGLIGSYYHGYREGFTKEIDQGVAELAGDGKGISSRWNSQVKIEWYRRELRKAGADLWYGTLGCGAFVEGNRVKGVAVATPQGRGVILAKTVIDATGSAAIAVPAGARSIYVTGEHIAVQGTGLPPWEPGARYTNTDWAFIDDIDLTDTWQSFVIGRKKFGNAYDLGQLIDSRERRQVLGDFFLQPMDVYLDRTFPDSVVRANSNFDSHGYTVHPMFMLRPPDRASLPCYVPYRCLLPKGVEGILVTGLAVSAHRDVMPVIRMQPDVQNQGYAAGVAAATAVHTGTTLRQIDIRQLQQHLVSKGNLPQEVLTHEDSFPLPKESIQEAVQCITNSFQQLEKVFAEPEQALPLLRDAYTAAGTEQDKLTYAHTLGIMGDPTGTDVLAKAVAASEWDEGWKYTGMGQFGRSMSPVDSLIIALGRSGRAAGLGVAGIPSASSGQALPANRGRDALDTALRPILTKVEQLGAEHALSHHRAVALALETLADPAAAKPLADLLQKPGMSGHAWPDIETATKNIKPSATDNSTRECSLRELILARALYRCGDHDGLGEKILRQYAQDLRGHYARHALAVLNEKTP